MLEERLPAALAWWRANGIDRMTQGTADAPVGIVTVGKAHLDTLHALDAMGLSRHPGLAIYKVGMTWPLETSGLRAFAAGKRLLLVVEEKRSFVEAQIRSALFNMADRPAVIGKTGLDDAPLLPAVMELSPELVAKALVHVLPQFGIEAAAPHALEAPERPDGLLSRAPTFCAGCPHNTSTRLPDGSFAMAGIGCHVMAMQNTPNTGLFSVMGGEGVAWTGLAPFTSMKHVFSNMGDGTYQHSGLLAIRQSVLAGTRITYKILYNDAVAMTGGQPNEGNLSAADIARQIWAENVTRIYLVADDPARLPPASELPPGVIRHGREMLPQVQAECAAFEQNASATQTSAEVWPFLRGDVFKSAVTRAGEWTPGCGSETSVPLFEDVKTLLEMPLLGVLADASNTPFQTVCSYWEWDFRCAEVAAATSDHNFLSEVAHGTEDWVGAGGLSNPAMLVRGLRWRIPLPPEQCQF